MAHVEVQKGEEGDRILSEMTELLDEKFCIRHVTLQLEWASSSLHDQEMPGQIEGSRMDEEREEQEEDHAHSIPIRSGRCRQASWLKPFPS